MSRAKLKLVEKRETRACACDLGTGHVKYKDGVGECDRSGMIHREIPQAACELKQAKDGYVWIVKSCPYCGDCHHHSGGPLTDNPRNHLGYRVNHCMPPYKVALRQYRLVEAI